LGDDFIKTIVESKNTLDWHGIPVCPGESRIMIVMKRCCLVYEASSTLALYKSKVAMFLMDAGNSVPRSTAQSQITPSHPGYYRLDGKAQIGAVTAACNKLGIKFDKKASAGRGRCAISLIEGKGGIGGLDTRKVERHCNWETGAGTIGKYVYCLTAFTTSRERTHVLKHITTEWNLPVLFRFYVNEAERQALAVAADFTGSTGYVLHRFVFILPYFD